MTFGVELVNIAYLQIEITNSINNRTISGNGRAKKTHNFKFSFFAVVYNRSKPHKTWFIWKWFFSLKFLVTNVINVIRKYYWMFTASLIPKTITYFISLYKPPIFFPTPTLQSNWMWGFFFLYIKFAITSFHPYRFLACTMASYTESCSNPRRTWDIRKWFPLVLVTVGMRIISCHLPGCWYDSFIYKLKSYNQYVAVQYLGGQWIKN